MHCNDSQGVFCLFNGKCSSKTSTSLLLSRLRKLLLGVPLLYMAVMLATLMPGCASTTSTSGGLSDNDKKLIMAEIEAGNFAQARSAVKTTSLSTAYYEKEDMIDEYEIKHYQKELREKVENLIEENKYSEARILINEFSVKSSYNDDLSFSMADSTL